jgi:hypothetical protein
MSNVLNIKERIEQANERAFTEMTKADPVWVGLAPASEVIAGMEPNLFLHAGSPIGWERMCIVQKVGILEAIIFEKLAPDRKYAEEMVKSGEITIGTHHDHGMTAPGGLITSASCNVFVIENRASGNRTYGLFPPMIPSMGLKVESLRKIIEAAGEFDLKPIFAEALRMGDDLHSRTDAGCLIFERRIAPTAAKTLSCDEAAELHAGLANFNLFFSLFSIPASKLIADAARNIEYSTIVTTMTRNGTDFGIRVSSTGDQWFTAPSPKVEALYLPGYSEEDALEDIGDSAITETVGFGGFSMAAAPAHTLSLGADADRALQITLEMREITHKEHPFYKIPALNFMGIPICIDIRKVVKTGILPVINTGVTHRDPDRGLLVGFGSARAPMACFTGGLSAFSKKYDL